MDPTEKIVYPTWKISCVRASENNDDLNRIKENTIAFSKAFMNGNYAELVDLYTEDGKIFPNNKNIISGKKGLTNYWTLPDDVKILHHKVTHSEITIDENFAYDYGVYEGKTLTKDQKEVSWKGKYVIIWKKMDNDWKIYLDIWNKIGD